MDKKRFSDLLEKHIKSNLSEEEMAELLLLMELIDVEEQQRLFDIDDQSAPENVIADERKNLLLERIDREVQFRKRNISFINRVLHAPLSKVAAIVIVLSAVTFWWFREHQNQRQQYAVLENNQPDIFLHADSLPAVRLPNGDVRIVAPGDDLLQKLGVKIVQDKQGHLCYQLQSAIHSEQVVRGTPKLVFISPHGRVSKVMLEDGTIIWLNSASTLEYPAAFNGDSRQVTLRGEAYFEVAHMPSKPFLVATETATIRVLGTVFNVSAYEDDPNMVTTLLEGSVKLSGQRQQFVLRPGEQAIADKVTGSMDKQRVSVEEFITWKEGYFNFSNQTISEILQSIKRWYDIDDIEYQVRPEERFTGTFKQSKSLRSLLNKLEKISNVKFQIKERRVVVMK